MPAEAYLLDTNIANAAWYEPDGRHREFRAWLSSRGEEPVFVSVISIAEVEYGMQIGRGASGTQRKVRRAMATYEVLDLDRHTGVIYGDIRARLFSLYAPKKRRGRINSKYVESLVDRTSGMELGIQENDLWIVSVAKRYNLILVTADRRGGMRKIVDAAEYDDRTQYWR